jgi:predicted Rossmann fold flavoprotein
MHDASGSDFFWDTNVQNVKKENDVFITETYHGIFKSKSVIVATGGTSFGTLGVSDIGFKVAKSFGHKIVPVRPALCAMSFKYFPTDFSGVSVVSEIKIGKQKIIDDLLFTHFGIGGPAIYRASVRDITDGLYINLAPDIDLRAMLNDAKHINGRKKLSTVLAEILPTRVAKWIAGDTDKNIADLNKDLINLTAEKTQNIFIPVHDIKYHNLQSAEVIRGGVDTENISSKTMESKLCSGLFFAGEVIDIAGDLGGFNLHWAWASGHTAGTYA